MSRAFHDADDAEAAHIESKARLANQAHFFWMPRRAVPILEGDQITNRQDGGKTYAEYQPARDRNPLL